MNDTQPTYYGQPIPADREKMIFVFGSNQAGIHGAGAARFALQHRGAILKQAVGRQGQSYGIPTKDRELRTLSTAEIWGYVNDFLRYARTYPDLTFQVTCIGCGLAGLNHADIAPMFKGAPANCQFDELWKPWLGDDVTYWGTF